MNGNILHSNKGKISSTENHVYGNFRCCRIFWPLYVKYSFKWWNEETAAFFDLCNSAQYYVYKRYLGDQINESHLCSGVRNSGNWARIRPATDMSRLSTCDIYQNIKSLFMLHFTNETDIYIQTGGKFLCVQNFHPGQRKIPLQRKFPPSGWKFHSDGDSLTQCYSFRKQYLAS